MTKRNGCETESGNRAVAPEKAAAYRKSPRHPRYCNGTDKPAPNADPLAVDRRMLDDPGLLASGQLRQVLHEEASAILLNRGMGEWKKVRAKHRRKKRQLAINAVLDARAPPPDGQHVYVIGCAGHPIKIGIAQDPAKRLGELQVGFPHKLRIYSTTLVTGGRARAVERECHRRLTDHRLNGEWFDLDAYEAAEMVRLVAAEIA